MTNKKLICVMSHCNNPKTKVVNVLVQHPICRRWKRWEVCDTCAGELEINKFRLENGKDWNRRWIIRYKRSPTKRYVIKVGSITDYIMEVPI